MWEKVAGWLGLPEFCSEEPGKSVLVGDSGEACVGKRCGVVGEVRGAKAREDAER